MSIVTGITLHTWLEEPEAMQAIQAWLAKHDLGPFGPLLDVTDSHGGDKNPQILVYLSGYNHFPNDEFIDLVMSLTWEHPWQCVLILQPEKGAPLVCRPPYKEEDVY